VLTNIIRAPQETFPYSQGKQENNGPQGSLISLSPNYIPMFTAKITIQRNVNGKIENIEKEFHNRRDYEVFLNANNMSHDRRAVS
jgi:hypothetical protein